MVSQDKLESERLNAKNTVEEYVYDIRDKISTTYCKFVTDKVSYNMKYLLYVIMCLYHLQNILFIIMCNRYIELIFKNRL